MDLIHCFSNFDGVDGAAYCSQPEMLLEQFSIVPIIFFTVPVTCMELKIYGVAKSRSRNNAIGTILIGYKTKIYISPVIKISLIIIVFSKSFSHVTVHLKCRRFKMLGLQSPAKIASF